MPCLSICAPRSNRSVMITPSFLPILEISIDWKKIKISENFSTNFFSTPKGSGKILKKKIPRNSFRMRFRNVSLGEDRKNNSNYFRNHFISDLEIWYEICHNLVTFRIVQNSIKSDQLLITLKLIISRHGSIEQLRRLAYIYLIIRIIIFAYTQRYANSQKLCTYIYEEKRWIVTRVIRKCLSASPFNFISIGPPNMQKISQDFAKSRLPKYLSKNNDADTRVFERYCKTILHSL